jgi:hypothetical protein
MNEEKVAEDHKLNTATCSLFHKVHYWIFLPVNLSLGLP